MASMNRLGSATSPYLRQHADNPVDWWEWGQEAFAEAKRRDVPILLSVGYSACHWCHVMAHESFENDQIAALMNQSFVNVKVDREERPDVDAVYMQATVALTGSGGWPMTVVLDHEGRPFFAGTYFPDRPRHGQASFPQIITAIATAWNERRGEVAGAAERIGQALRDGIGQAPNEAVSVDAALVTEQALAALRREYDARAGGFGQAPKFPPSMVLEFLRVSGEREMFEHTLEAMARGGLYDQLAGGFARYCVDRTWTVPHFEKMLYDNALLLAVYAKWGTPLGDRVARETADFLVHEFVTDEGAFAAAFDADSDGAEGTFYVWTPAELDAVLGAEDGAWAARLLNVTESGTFEHGASTLQLLADPDDGDRWARVGQKLLEARSRRTRPARDDKVVTAWNGLAISGLVAAGRWLGESKYVAAAQRAAEFVWANHLIDGRLRRASIYGQVGAGAGVLEDYGALAAGLLDLAAATGEPHWLDRARILLETAQEHFYAGEGHWYDVADDAEQLVARPSDATDNASPSGTSAVLTALVSYAAMTGESYDIVEATLARVGTLMTRSPRFAGWSLAAMVANEAPEIAIIGPVGAERDALTHVALRAPGAVVVACEEGTPIPLALGRGLVEGQAAAYVCHRQVCQRPVTTATQLAQLLSE